MLIVWWRRRPNSTYDLYTPGSGVWSTPPIC